MFNSNLEIEKFQKELYSLINNADLAAGTIYYILKTNFFEVEKAYQQILKMEQQQNDQNQEQE